MCILCLSWLQGTEEGRCSDPVATLAQSIGDPQKFSTTLPTDLPFDVQAGHYDVDLTTGIATLKGNVTVTVGSTHIRADNASFNEKTREITAEGKVILRVGGDVLEAERITYKFKDQTGVIYNGKLLLGRHNIYLDGKKLEKTADSSYRIEEGSFTTCDGTSPAWRITGKELDVTVGGYGTLKHGLFYVKNVPVVYLPWMVYPAKRQRQTGFLMPTMANSTFKGIDARFPFFIAFSPSADATVVPRICTKRAVQTGVEVRYFPYENVQGRMYGEYTYDWQYAPEHHPKPHRFFLTFRHDQDFTTEIKLKANGTWISDRDYFETWGSRFDKRLRVRYLESNAVLFRQTNDFLFQAEARYFDNLDLPDNALTIQNLPTVTATLFTRQVPYIPLYVNSNVAFDHFHSPVMHKQWLGSRLQVDARVSVPLALGRFLKVEPAMNYFAKAYLADYFVRDKSISSVQSIRTDLYQVSTDVFTDLTSIFDGSVLGFQKIQHTFRPRFLWTYRPFRSAQTYPQFDETDRLDRVSLLTTEMRHTFTGRLGPGEYLDFLTLTVSQGYNFNAPLPSDMTHPYPWLHADRWTPTQAELVLKPHSLVDLSAQAEYDPAVNRARRFSLDFGLMDHRGDLFRVFHQFAADEKTEELSRQTNLNLQVKITSALDCFFENQYSHQHNFSYFTSFGINYHPQCWSILLRYSEVREKDPVTQKIKEPDQTVFMTLSLYGLGQIYRVSRDWGEILGQAGEPGAIKTR